MTSLRLHDDTPSPDRPIRTAVVGRVPAESKLWLSHERRLQLTGHTDLKELFQTPDEVLPPELILVFQAWSEEFAARDVHRLLATFPLARVLCVYGSLCDSDGRTRSIWPLACRIPAWKLADRLEREIAVLRHAAPALPVTATREEIIRFELATTGGAAAAGPPDQPDAKATVLLCSPDYGWRSMLAEQIRERVFGGAPHFTFPFSDLAELDPWIQNPQAAPVFVIDIDPRHAARAAALADRWPALSRLPVALVSSFPASSSQIEKTLGPAVQRQHGQLFERFDLAGILRFVSAGISPV